MLQKISRDLIMFGLGAFGFMHELLISTSERPYIIGGCLTLMGIPLALRLDEWRSKKNGNGPRK